MFALSRFSVYFLAVTKANSIRKAAEKLHVSASAIDRQILMVEAELETPLFERLPQGLRLTAAGEVLTAAIGRWEREFGQTLALIDEMKGLRRGHVDLAVINALSEGIVPESIGALSERFPGITVGVAVLDNALVAKRIADGDVDAGILLGPPSMMGLEVLERVGVPLGIVVPPGHPLAHKASVRLGQTLEYRTIFPAAPLVIHEHAQRLYASHQIDSAKFVQCNNTQMMRALIKRKVGIGMVSRLDVQADVEAGLLCFIPLSDAGAGDLSLALCVASNRQPSRAAREVIGFLAGALRGEGAPDAVC